MAENQNSRTARIAGWLGMAAPVVVVIGILINQLGAPPMTGFALLQLGLLLALIAVVTGVIGFFLTRGGVGGRGQALTGAGIGVLLIVLVVLGAGPGGSGPPINDITTNLADPPTFAPAPAGHRNEGRDMAYPADFVPQVRAAYGDLAPVRVSLPQADAYALAIGQAEALGWEVTRRDPAAGTFEAEDATALYRFVDDVTVRVAADGAGRSVIDIRSKSRDGRGDLGANAARIRDFAGAVTDASQTGVAASPAH